MLFLEFFGAFVTARTPTLHMESEDQGWGNSDPERKKSLYNIFNKEASKIAFREENSSGDKGQLFLY